jgi:hypothetical protein
MFYDIGPRPGGSFIELFFFKLDTRTELFHSCQDFWIVYYLKGSLPKLSSLNSFVRESHSGHPDQGQPQQGIF